MNNPPLAAHRPDHAGEEQNGGERQQRRKPVQFIRLAAGFAFFLLGWRKPHSPENCRQAEDERHVGDVVDERVDHHVRAGTAVAAEDEGEDEVAEAGAIRHDERAEYGALEALGAHRFEPPEHQERRDDEQRQEQPRCVRPLGFDPMDERVEHGREVIGKFLRRDIEVFREARISRINTGF